MYGTLYMPFWLELILSPFILWIIISTFLGSWLAWKTIIKGSGETLEKEDRKRAIVGTWLTMLLSNLFSCLVLLIVEFVMRSSDNSLHFQSLTIWDDPITAFVYILPVLISFLVILFQVRRSTRRYLPPCAQARISTILLPFLFTPWFILIPTSLIHNIT